MLKRILFCSAAIIFLLAQNAIAGRSVQKQVVNLKDAGLIRNPYGSVPEVLSCQFGVVPGTNTIYELTSIEINAFIAQPGIKYVYPINRDSSCDGYGINVGIFQTNQDGVNIYSRMRPYDLYLEEIATGQRYSVNQPDGCEFRQNNHKSIMIKSDLKGYQLVFETTKADGYVGGNVSFLRPSQVDQICNSVGAR
jgi:hypothetical protein